MGRLSSSAIRTLVRNSRYSTEILRADGKSVYASRRLLHIYIPDKYETRPERKLEDSYIHVPSNIPYLTTTLSRIIDHQAETIGDRIGYVVSYQGIRKTFADLKKDAEDMANGLLSLGLLPGDRLGMWGPNSYEWIVTMFAASKAGLILVNVNPAYKVHELEYCMNKVQMKAIIAAEGVATLKYYEHFQELLPELSDKRQTRNITSKRLPHLKHIVMLTKKPENFPGTYSLAEVVDMKKPENQIKLEKIAALSRPDDPFNIQFTSGTTGSPKGATLSYHGMINCAYFSGLRLGAGTLMSSVICPLPLYHIFACVGNLLVCTIFGAKLVLPSEKFDAEAVLRAVQDEKPECFNGVPTMFADVLQHPDFAKYDLSSLKFGVMGGSPCPPELVKDTRDKLGLNEFACGYGSTEQSLATFIGYRGDSADIFTTTTGYPLAHTEAKIVDSEGRIVPIGEKGELWTRNFGTMLGYWDDETKTNEAIRSDRWLMSGDLGVVDERGYLKIVGRLKDMIIRGGENVYPTEIENRLLENPHVGNVTVCGVPDERMGEEICAWVRLKKKSAKVAELDNYKSIQEELKTFLQTKLAKYKTPKYFIFYTNQDDIPMTVTGKIQKFKLTEMAVERLKLLELSAKAKAVKEQEQLSVNCKRHV